LPETHNPKFQPRSGGIDLRSLLTFVLVAIAISIGEQHIDKVLVYANHAQFLTRSAVAAPAPTAPAKMSANLNPQTDFGWLGFIAKPLYVALQLIQRHGIANWGWAIVTLTAIFNLVLIWPRIVAVKSSFRMMRVQPKIEALKKDYADLKISDPRRAGMNTEMMGIYKAEGASMYGGCLPMLLQVPLLFAYVRVLQGAPELHHAGWLWLADLSRPDPLHILPLFIILTMFLTQWITPMPATNRSQRRVLAVAMPLVMGISLWRYAAGLSLYWATGNLINLVFQILMNRSSVGKEMVAMAAAKAVFRS
jgi:YidC/Oxa1 family membrane protein insertase